MEGVTVVGEAFPSSRRDWAGVAKFVRNAYPEWVDVGIYNPSTASHMRNYKYKDISPDEFRITTRATGVKRRVHIFLRLKEGDE
jgi:hypothetical protein